MKARLRFVALCLMTAYLWTLLGGQRLGAGRAEAAGQPGFGLKSSTVRMQVEAGYGGNFRPAAWVPIRVRVTNLGPNFSGSLSVSDDGKQSTGAQPANHITYRRAIEMPQGGVKDFTLYVPGADLGNALTVVLVAGPLGFAQQQVPLNALSNSTLLVGVLSRNPVALTQLKSVAGQMGGIQLITTPLDARRLDPQPLALANLDALVLDDYNSSELSSAQRVALEDWVRAGGTLITLGGPTAQSTLGGLPPALRLVRPGQPLALPALPSLARLGGPLPSGQSVIATGQVLAGTVVMGAARTPVVSGSGPAAGTPLVVERSLGLGAVIYCAIDPTLGPTAAWSGLPHLWSFLTAEARSGGATLTTSLAGAQQNSSRNDTLDSEIDNVAPPSIALFVILLGLYVLVLVPANFIILGRLRKRDWSWLTLPSLALILVVATYGSAYYGRGRNVRTSVVSAVYLTSGGDRVVAQSAVGLFSPVAGDYTIKPDSPDQLITALFSSSTNSNTLSLTAAQDQSEVSMPGMAMWSSRNVTLIGVTTYQHALEGSLRATANGHLVGTLSNPSGVTWHGLVVVPYAGQPQALGDLAPGRQLQVDIPSGNAATGGQSLGDFYGQSAALLPGEQPARSSGLLAVLGVQMSGVAGDAVRLLADTNTIPTNPQESTSERFQHIVDQVFGSANPAMFGQVVVLGWTADPLSGFSVNGDRPGRQDTNLLVQAVPVEPAPGPFVINANTLPVRLAGSEQDLQQGFGSAGFSISSNSSATFVGHLPLPAPGHGHLLLRSLTLSVNSSGAGGALDAQTAALYDWSSGSWVGVDVSSGQVDVRHPDRFVNALGAVRVKLSAQDSTLGIDDPSSGVLLGATGVVR